MPVRHKIGQIHQARLCFTKHPVDVKPRGSGKRWVHIEARMDGHCLKNCCYAVKNEEICVVRAIYGTVQRSCLLYLPVLDAQLLL